MTSRKLDEVATDLDDAKDLVEELQVAPATDADEKLDDLDATLEDATTKIDELEDEDDE